MDIRRRQLLAFAGAGSVALAAPVAPRSSVAELSAAGLDPFATYARMFASMGAGEEFAWWFMGALPMNIEDIGLVPFVQEETIRLGRADRLGPGQIEIRWRDLGVFRDVASGAVPSNWYNPIKGAAQPQTSQLKGGVSRQLVSKDGAGLAVTSQGPNTTVSAITVDGRISGDRVCLTHIEEKSRAGANGTAPVVLRTVLKIYASLAELQGSQPRVAASGFYGVRNLTTGNVFVNGLMQKAGLDEKVNSLAWERLQEHFPDFFKGNRLLPNWT